MDFFAQVEHLPNGLFGRLVGELGLDGAGRCRLLEVDADLLEVSSV